MKDLFRRSEKSGGSGSARDRIVGFPVVAQKLVDLPTLRFEHVVSGRVLQPGLNLKQPGRKKMVSSSLNPTEVSFIVK